MGRRASGGSDLQGVSVQLQLLVDLGNGDGRQRLLHAAAASGQRRKR